MHILVRDLVQCFWTKFNAMGMSHSFWIVLARMLESMTAHMIWMQEWCVQVGAYLARSLSSYVFAISCPMW